MFLFDSPIRQPLAARMRPQNLDEFIGQEHIVGPGRLLRRAIQQDQLSSLILYGPPGTGKTTIAKIITQTTKSHFIALNAVLSGLKEVRKAISEAQEQRSLYGLKSILFVDEVHRWNKSQQDSLLPWVEDGLVILIGATTENPYFEVNKALVSRSRVFCLKSLTAGDLTNLIDLCLDNKERGYGNFNVELTAAARQHLIQMANGDARSLLNALELAVETSVPDFPPATKTRIYIDLSIAEESIQKKAVLYDKDGDYHFDSISAFIKSIRGSDIDASLYWMARMLSAGEDPHYLFRRMLISASEDVGMADPQALVFVNNAANAFDRIGMPEGQFFLSQAAIYLASAEKSNSTMAYFSSLKAVEEERNDAVPKHLKDSNRDAKTLGHGQGYLYPHAYKDHWVPQNYLPKSLREKIFYHPGKLGFEATIRERVLYNREVQLLLMAEAQNIDIEGLQQKDNKHAWLLRSTANQQQIEELRNKVFACLPSLSIKNILILGEQASGFFLWKVLRSYPESTVFIKATDGKAAERLKVYAQNFNPTQQEIVFLENSASWNKFLGELNQQELFIDLILAKSLFHTRQERLIADLSPKSFNKIILLEEWPGAGSTPISIIETSLRTMTSDIEQLKTWEAAFYQDFMPQLDSSFARLLTKQQDFKLEFPRLISRQILNSWEQSKYAQDLLLKNTRQNYMSILEAWTQLENKEVNWLRAYRIYTN